MFTRNAEIDRLRAIAVIITMYAHLDFVFLGTSDGWFQASKQWVNGSTGVYLFFVISGYVISASFLPSLDAAAAKTDVLLGFWIRRLTRIVPMALLWIAVPLALSVFFNWRGMFHSFEDNIGGALAAALNYLNVALSFGFATESVFGVYWSLSLEQQFYLLFPALALAAAGPARFAAVVIAIAAMALIPPHWVPLRMDAILAGVLLFLIVGPRRGEGPAVPKWVGITVTTALVAALVTTPMIWPAGWWPDAAQRLALLGFALVWLATRRRGFVLPLGRRLNAVTDWIGTRSYGLYLIHIPAYMLAGEIAWRLQFVPGMPGSFQWVDTPAVRAIIAATILLSVTELCYRFVERPAIEYGRQKAAALTTRRPERPRERAEGQGWSP